MQRAPSTGAGEALAPQIVGDHPGAMHHGRGAADTAASLSAHFAGAAFTVAQAEERGISARRVTLAADARMLVRVRRGLYLVGDPDALEQSDCARADARLAVAQHRVEQLRDSGIPAALAEETSAAIWGLPHDPGPPSTLLIPRGTTAHLGTRYGIRLREGDLRDTVTFRGMTLTSPLATARDICRGLPRYKAVALFGLAVRRHAEWLLAGDDRMDPGDLTQALADAEWRADLAEEMRGMLAASPRRLPWCASADPRPETYLEGISWGRFTGWKLGDMRPQAWVRGASGRLYRVDVLIDGVAGEADGAIKYGAPDALWKEKRRQEDIEEGGTRVVRWTYADAEHHPDRLLQRWRRALAHRAA